MNEKTLVHRPLRPAAGKSLVVFLLAVVTAFLLVELVRPLRPADAQVTAGQQGKVLAVAGQITQNSYGLYLFDRETCIMTVYEWLPGKRPGTGVLQLLAARNCTFDLQLDEYNTEPSPNETIKKLVRQAKSISSPESP